MAYTHMGGSAIFSNTCRWFTKNLIKVYTPRSGSTIYNVLMYTTVGGLPVALSKCLHNCFWFTSKFVFRFTHLLVAWQYATLRFKHIMVDENK